MGIAAYNRGTEAIRRQITAQLRPVEFEIMERLNALCKYPVICPGTGFGFLYRTIDECVRRWRVTVVAFDKGKWICDPLPRP